MIGSLLVKLRAYKQGNRDDIRYVFSRWSVCRFGMHRMHVAVSSHLRCGFKTRMHTPKYDVTDALHAGELPHYLT